jgi:hypothetical protein
MNYHDLIEKLRNELKENAHEYTIEELRAGYDDLMALIDAYLDRAAGIPVIKQDF